MSDLLNVATVLVMLYAAMLLGTEIYQNMKEGKRR